MLLWLLFPAFVLCSDGFSNFAWDLATNKRQNRNLGKKNPKLHGNENEKLRWVSCQRIFKMVMKYRTEIEKKKQPQNTRPSNKVKIPFKIGCIHVRLYTHWKLNATQSKKKILLTSYFNCAKIGNFSIYIQILLIYIWCPEISKNYTINVRRSMNV